MKRGRIELQLHQVAIWPSTRSHAETVSVLKKATRGSVVAQTRKSDILLLAVTNFIWATGWSAIKYTQAQMGPVVLNCWTLGISVVTLLPFAWLEYRQDRGSSAPLTARDYLDYAIMGLFGVTGMTLLYALGARLSLAANGALISMTVPIFTALIAVAVLAERLTRARVVSFVIALIGVLIISDMRWGSVSLFGSYATGNLHLLLGAIGNSVYVVYGKKLLHHIGPMTVLFWGQVLGVIGSLPFLYLEPFHLKSINTFTSYTWLSLVFLGVIYFAVSMVLFYKVLVRLDAGQIMVFTYLQPVFGVVMAVILLHEKVTHGMIIGGVLVVAGTLGVAFEKPRQPAETQ
jgi:drug/metabolite transporter (DMT)-like permease